MANQYSKYELRGVSSDKMDVHNAIKNFDKGLYKNAFCKILPDFISNSAEHCCVMHVDTAGTKTSLAYIYWKETNDISIWKGIVQDAMIMNMDDMACVGIYDKFLLSSNIARNKKAIPSEVLSEIISSSQVLIDQYAKYGIHISHAGGETADVGDIVRTIDVGFTMFAHTERKNIIENNIKPGDVIVGLASYGQATYENEYNSGIGCNGLTSARHDTLQHQYATKYPETYDSNIDKNLVYNGNWKITDIEPSTGLSIGKLLLSPTRTYVPLLKKVIEAYRSEINGLIHCTGGGQTKVLKFVENVHIIKNNLLKTPVIFDIIQRESDTSFYEMYKTYNMGHRMEIYTSEKVAQQIINIAKSFNIDAQIIGYCEKYNGKKLSIHCNNEVIEYSYD